MSAPHRLGRLSARMVAIYLSDGIGALAGKIVGRLHPAGRAYRRRKAEEDRRFDAAGYDTGGIQRIYGMDIAGTHAAAGVNHIAAPPQDFDRALAAVDFDVAGATFVDLGSGKGRAVLMAAEHPFARTIGVEFARELHQVAEANRRLREQRHGPDPRIAFLYADAAAFRFPSGPIVLFIFNAFDPPVLTAVVRNALASWRADPRPFRVLYLNPVHLHAWTKGGWRLLWAGDGLAIYSPPEE